MAVKLFSSSQGRAEVHSHQTQQPQQHTLSRSSCTTSTFVSHLCNICDVSTIAAASTSYKGIHLNNPRDSEACKPDHLTRSAEPRGNERTAAQSRGQLTFFLVVDNQQAGPSRPLTFTLMPKKHFNSPSSATGEEYQHNISGLSSFFGNLQSVMSYQQIDNHSFFHKMTCQDQPPLLQPPLPSLNLILLRSQATSNSSRSRTTAFASNQSFSTAANKLKVLFKTTQIFQKRLIAVV